MTRIVKVGAGGGEVDWKTALKNVQQDDVLLLEPGFYELDAGSRVSNFTIKGMGANPEDTVIYGYFVLDQNCNYFTLENLCLTTRSDKNSLFIDELADTYLTLRNVVVRGGRNNAAAIAANGKCTLELYSTKIVNSSVSMFEHADFRLTMTDTLIDYPVSAYSAIGIQGHGTAIISNSIIKGSINTYEDANCELNLNNTTMSLALIHGQTWVNMLNCQVTADHDAAFYASETSWVNVVNSDFNGGIYLDQHNHSLIQNAEIDRLIACNDVHLTLINSTIDSHADFQDKAYCEAIGVAFSGSPEFEYFLALADHARLAGHDLVLNPNHSALAVKDNAQVKLNVISSGDKSLQVDCVQKPNVNILGMHWTTKKPE